MRDCVWREVWDKRAALGWPLVVPEVNMMAAASLGGFIGFKSSGSGGGELFVVVLKVEVMMSVEKACRSVTGIDARIEEAEDVLLVVLVSR